MSDKNGFAHGCQWKKWLHFLPIWSLPVYMCFWPLLRVRLGPHLSSYLFGVLFLAGISFVTLGVHLGLIKRHESAIFGLGVPAALWILVVILKNLLAVGIFSVVVGCGDSPQASAQKPTTNRIQPSTTSGQSRRADPCRAVSGDVAAGPGQELVGRVVTRRLEAKYPFGAQVPGQSRRAVSCADEVPERAS